MTLNSCEPSQNGSSDWQCALLIDADNVSHSRIAAILAELGKTGTANVRRAYGDWTSATLKGWKDKLHEYAIRPVQQFCYSSGKNASDIALVIDALELLYTRRPAAFALASSDADFTPLVMHLRDAGCEVFGFGDRKTPMPFVNACSRFLYLDSLDDGAEEDAVPAVATAPQKTPTKQTPPTLAHDAKLVQILRNAVVAGQRDDGWTLLSNAGGHAKRVSSIDPRNYGIKNFPALFEATGLFDIVRPKGAQPLIADKRNKDRAASPKA